MLQFIFLLERLHRAKFEVKKKSYFQWNVYSTQQKKLMFLN